MPQLTVSCFKYHIVLLLYVGCLSWTLNRVIHWFMRSSKYFRIPDIHYSSFWCLIVLCMFYESIWMIDLFLNLSTTLHKQNRIWTYQFSCSVVVSFWYDSILSNALAYFRTRLFIICWIVGSQNKIFGVKTMLALGFECNQVTQFDDMMCTYTGADKACAYDIT